MVIVETDFLSSFVKIESTGLIFKAFNTSKITIPSAVLHELEKTLFFEKILEMIDSNSIEVRKVNVAVSEKFGAGELECITLAKETDEILLMNDQVAIKYAEKRGITLLDVPTFLLYCKRKNIVSKREIQQMIHLLKEKDYYEFNNEVKQTLLQ